MIKFPFHLILGFVLLTGLAFAGGEEIPPPPDVIPTAAPTETPSPYHYRIPEKTPDGWPVADLRRDKADVKKISREMDRVSRLPWAAIHSLLVFHHGKLVLEEYYGGYGRDSAQALFSCTKSVFSTVFGIARDQGLLDPGQKLYDLYPEERSKPGWEPGKDGITLGHLLSMTSGLGCDDVGLGSENCGSRMTDAPDWLAFCFVLPLAHPVGTVWTYNGSCLALIARQIALKSGMSFPDFAQKYLLGPLGIQGNDWIKGPKGVDRVDYGLHWKARDMGKLGQLYLDRGMWKGKRILSEDWVKEATSPHSPLGQAFGETYGYLWYIKDTWWKGKPVVIFNARGYEGQMILVAPDADLVCVITAGSADDRIYGMEMDLFERTILNGFY